MARSEPTIQLRRRNTLRDASQNLRRLNSELKERTKDKWNEIKTNIKNGLEEFFSGMANN